MFPGSGDLCIYDFTVVNKRVGGAGYLKVSKAKGWLSTARARSQALVRQPNMSIAGGLHLLWATLTAAWGRGEVPISSTPTRGTAGSSRERMECSEIHYSGRLSASEQRKPQQPDQFPCL